MNFEDYVLNHYDSNQRVLPWRDSRNPYHIWVSEIMLQQTRVQTVIPYYNKFITELPDIESLANASDDKIYKLWEGLGYYSRVRNLRKAANQVIEIFDGVLPKDRKSLETLAGIGPYTSGAISSIAFGIKNAAIDGNVLRIFARLYEIKKSIKDKDVKKDIAKRVNALLPNVRIGDFNQGLMEIGATVCLPNGQPKCYECPLNHLCLAYKNGTTNEIPVKNKKKPVPRHKKTIVLLRYQDSYAIEKRPPEGLLQSMYQFPMLEEHITFNEIMNRYNVRENQIELLPKAKHKFTHLEWDMIGYRINLTRKNQLYTFAPIDKINNELSIPSAFKQYKKVIMEDNNE